MVRFSMQASLLMQGGVFKNCGCDHQELLPSWPFNNPVDVKRPNPPTTFYNTRARAREIVSWLDREFCSSKEDPVFKSNRGAQREHRSDTPP